MPEKLCYVSNKEPFEYTLGIISGKWKMKNIYLLSCSGTVRYGVLMKNIDGITHKMLSTQLDELEAEEIIARVEYPQIPPKVEYSLTRKGESLIPIVTAMCEWGAQQRS
ncbi:winged helix-turn-helix transcriptional regulator [Paenibacillus sp. NPDC057934]|uniref:winged helix-turn-helix transcriptional regulator n=1 Tax=Paenibacillus sp. NPDC057934 TaxID=3346282 RepID=UPI0036D77932